MKKYPLLSIAFLFFVFTFTLSSCKRNDPVPEIDLEEFDEVKLTFINKKDANDLIIVNIDKLGKPDRATYSLNKNESYLMEIELFSNSESINYELIEDIDEHQFFFLVPADAVQSYIYKDENLGLQGEIKFTERSTVFDFNIVLRHGLDKSHPAAKDWNSSNFVEAGGADDLSASFKIKLVNKE